MEYVLAAIVFSTSLPPGAFPPYLPPPQGRVSLNTASSVEGLHNLPLLLEWVSGNEVGHELAVRFLAQVKKGELTILGKDKRVVEFIPEGTRPARTAEWKVRAKFHIDFDQSYYALVEPLVREMALATDPRLRMDFYRVWAAKEDESEDASAIEREAWRDANARADRLLEEFREANRKPGGCGRRLERRGK